MWGVQYVYPSAQPAKIMKGEKMQNTLTERIQKLLSLATSDVEHEARSAMLKAQALMAENDLTMEQVTAVKPEEQEAVEGVVDKENSTIQYWQKFLTSVIVHNFRCQAIYRSYGSGNRDIVIIGMPEDVEACNQTLQFAFTSAKNCWTKYRKGREYVSRRQTEGAKKDFMHGFARGLRDAFEAQVQEKAIVLVQNPKVKNHMDSMKLGKEAPTKRTTRRDDHALSHGYQDGRKLNGGGTLLAAPPA